MAKMTKLSSCVLLILAVIACSQSPISEADARVIALERLRDPETYRDVGYNPALMPQPKMERLKDGYWYVWDDSVQAVSVFILVNHSGSTEVSFNYMDGYTNPWKSK